MNHHIPEKANRVLNLIILGFLLILIRVWYLAVIQHDEQLEKARKPKRRTVIERVERATIRDRFNIPLALNKIQYHIAVCYADIRQIPATKWEINSEGKRLRVPVRSEYIKKLSHLLAEELHLDAQTIEDTIHGKASLFPHTPFILKEGLSEEEYARFKMLEKDWVGIRAEQGSRRYYPLGKVGSDVIGYMGAISSQEYDHIAQEIKTLQAYLSEREAGEMPMLPKGFQNPLEVKERLRFLQEKAYSINDLVGKSGVEAVFDTDLRGYAGKKIYEVDTKGNVLRELPGSRQGIAGQRLLLTISAELQEFAEQLLTNHEAVRENRREDGSFDWSTPWIKGGAIVALDPNTGEVLALASYPRIDPNDFIPSRSLSVKTEKQTSVAKWLENETYMGEIWDGKRRLERERFNEKTNAFFYETMELNLNRYLEIILPPHSSALVAMQKIGTVGNALALQKEIETLLTLSGQTKVCALIDALYADNMHRPSKIPISTEEKRAIQEKLACHVSAGVSAKQKIDAILGSVKYNDDKLLVIDLCHMLVDEKRFPSNLLEAVNSLSLSGFRELNQSASIVQSFLQTQARLWFHQIDFQKWREKNFKSFLKQKREEEREKRLYAKPYTEYLEQLEKQMFKIFWDEHRFFFMHAFIQNISQDKIDPSWIAYLDLMMQAKRENPQIKMHAEKLRDAMVSLTDELQMSFLHTMRSFEELDRPLYGHYRSLRNHKGVQLEKHLAAAFYPLAGYGYGRSQAFRQSTPQGSVFKLIVAYQALFERYRQLKILQQSLSDLNPLTLIDNIKWHPKTASAEQVLGATLDGQMIKRLYKGGLLPRSHPNIGKIDLVGAIEQSSNIYFSILAGDCISDPLNLVHACRNFGLGEKTGIELPGEIAGLLPDDISYNRTGLYSFAIGQHSLIVTPLQTAVMLAAIANQGKVLKPKIVQLIAGQESLREYGDPFLHEHFPFQEDLAAIGIHFPLFTAIQKDKERPYVWCHTSEIKRTLFMPDPIRDLLIQGMHQVIVGPKGTARPQIIRALTHKPEWRQDFLELKDQLIGKTGTAEILYKQTIDAESSAQIRNHIWFAGISFAPDQPQRWEKPELVVVIYLRYSESGGKEAAPLGIEIIKKWREICKHHGRRAYVSMPIADQNN